MDLPPVSRLAEPVAGIIGRFRRLAAAVGIFLLAIILFNVLVATGPEVVPQQREEVVNRVQVVDVALADARPVYVAFGTVEATRRAELRFSVGGEVESVEPGFRNGAVAREGELLARLDDELLLLARDEASEQLDAETVNIESLETQLELRQRQFDRASRMREAAVISEARFDDSRLALSQASNALNQASSRQRQLELRLRRAERDLREARLTAPFTGVVSAVDIGVGKVVGSTTVVGYMTDTGNLEVSFVVPSEIYARSIELIGEDVDIVWKAGGRDVVSVSGEVVSAEGLVNSAEGGGRLYASIPGPEEGDSSGTVIPPGAFVEVRVASIPLAGVAVLPDVALFNNDTVYVVEAGRSSSRRVEVLARSEGKIFVTGELADGDRVIATRIPGLGEGLLVEAFAP